MNVRLAGDGSYLSLVDPSRYKSFVGPDWAEHPRLLEPHFIEQMKNKSLLVWGTGFGADWIVEFQEGISSDNGFREEFGSIENTADCLYLSNYDALSMCAQFEHHQLPTEKTGICKISLPPGHYRIRIVQKVDPETYFESLVGDDDPDEDYEKIESRRVVEFLIQYAKTDQPTPAWAVVPWSPL